MRLAELYFGDVEALDEGRLHPDYFDATFTVPTSFTLESLNNRRNFLIVGRKGSGKTAVQFHLGSLLGKKGYLSKFFSFYNDLRPGDHLGLARTQRIDFLELGDWTNIAQYYDFREIWERIFFIKIAEGFRAAGVENELTRFALGSGPRLSKLLQGIVKATRVKFSADMSGVAVDLGFNGEDLSSPDVALSDFNSVCREIFRTRLKGAKFYLFVDELVFSKLDGKDDEVRTRAAMVRDILRQARDLNIFFAVEEIDIHIICAIRPEVRNLINDIDSEIGKITNGKDVILEWSVEDGEKGLLSEIFRRKIRHSGIDVPLEEFLHPRLAFGDRDLDVYELIKRNTWGRPRDLVRLLLAIQKSNPDGTAISENEIKNGLDAYSRASMAEIADELGVRHGGKVVTFLRQAINRNEYRRFEDFFSILDQSKMGVDPDVLVDELFYFGVIGNIKWTYGRPRYFFFHRNEEYLKRDYGVMIHPGLWHYFNVRGN